MIYSRWGWLPTRQSQTGINYCSESGDSPQLNNNPVTDTFNGIDKGGIEFLDELYAYWTEKSGQIINLSEDSTLPLPHANLRSDRT